MDGIVLRRKQNKVTISHIAWSVFAALVIVPALSILAFSFFRPIIVLPRITVAPGFALFDQNGDRVNSENFRGKPTLISFSNINCQPDSNVCGLSVEEIDAVRSWLSDNLADTYDLRFATFSLDPENDDPAVINDALAHFTQTADPIEWVWLTGGTSTVRAVVGGGYELFYKDTDEGVSYQPRFVLLDSLGMVRARYGSAEPDLEILARDINYLAEEASTSNQFIYEAAHLFACYPR